MYNSIFQSAFTTLTPILGDAIRTNHADAVKTKPLGSESRNQRVKSIKSKVIEILEFIMDLRLHLRITNLLILFKQLYIAAPTNRQGGMLSGNVATHSTWQELASFAIIAVQARLL